MIAVFGVAGEQNSFGDPRVASTYSFLLGCNWMLCYLSRTHLNLVETKKSKLLRK